MGRPAGLVVSGMKMAFQDATRLIELSRQGNEEAQRQLHLHTLQVLRNVVALRCGRADLTEAESILNAAVAVQLRWLSQQPSGAYITPSYWTSRVLYATRTECRRVSKYNKNARSYESIEDRFESAAQLRAAERKNRDR